MAQSGTQFPDAEQTAALARMENDLHLARQELNASNEKELEGQLARQEKIKLNQKRRKEQLARQEQINLYEKDLQDQEVALKPVEKRFKRNLVLAAFATLITPLSLFLIIPVLRKSPSHGAKKVALVLVGLIPFVSGIISLSCAVGIKWLTTPRAAVVKTIVDGTPDQVKARYQEKRRLFKEKYPDVDWAALKKIGAGGQEEKQEEKAAAAPGTTKAVMKIIDIYRIKRPNPVSGGKPLPWQDMDEYSSDEAMHPGQTTKPRKIYVSVGTPSKPQTAIFQDYEQNKRRELIEEGVAHRVVESVGGVLQSDRSEGGAPSQAKRVFQLFERSMIRSSHIVAKLKEKHPEVEQQVASPKA